MVNWLSGVEHEWGGLPIGFPRDPVMRKSDPLRNKLYRRLVEIYGGPVPKMVELGGTEAKALAIACQKLWGEMDIRLTLPYVEGERAKLSVSYRKRFDALRRVEVARLRSLFEVQVKELQQARR